MAVPLETRRISIVPDAGSLEMWSVAWGAAVPTPVQPAGLQLPFYIPGKGQHDVFFVDPRCTDGARIDAAMAGIERDHRDGALHRRGTQRRNRRGGRSYHRWGGPHRHQETGAVGRFQIDDQAPRFCPSRFESEHPCNLRRIAQIEHKPPGSGAKQAITQSFYQTAASAQPIHRQREFEFRQIDHNPERIGQSEDTWLGSLAKIDHETGGAVADSDPQIFYFEPSSSGCKRGRYDCK